MSSPLTRNLPIGEQRFDIIRKRGFVYVDKTHFIASLLPQSGFFFLSRPRRFGKSLFLSTLKAYYEGKKELFHQLYIEKWEEEQAKLEGREAWQEYPVLYLDLNAKNYENRNKLLSILDAHLSLWEKEYLVTEVTDDPEGRLQYLLRHIYETTHRQIIVLIDEYDKPLLSTFEDDAKELNESYRKILKGFFAVLKSADPYLRFVFITGVTRFSKVSLFSDLNNLYDLSSDAAYSAICGITEAELQANFQPEIKSLGEKQNLNYEATLARLRQEYDGYLFVDGGEHVYNPFSLLNAFSRRDFRDYWFQSGTPTFLVNYLKAAHFYLPDLQGNVEMDLSSLGDYRADVSSPIPILFQAGYLTIKSYDRELDLYRLGYPNDEVKYGFIKNLLPAYTSLYLDDGRRVVAQFYKDVRDGKVDEFMNTLSDLLEKIPYSATSKEDVQWREQNYQIAVALIFQFMGIYVQTEVHSAKGRADCIVHTQDVIYVFEFKLWSSGTAAEALEQIQSQEYYKPLRLERKKLVLIGASFDEEKRNIKEWEILRV